MFGGMIPGPLRMDCRGTPLWQLVAALATLLAAVVAGGQTPHLHEMLTADELRILFNVDFFDQVPEYEIVSLFSRARRSTQDPDEEVRMVNLNVFGSHRVLELRRNKHLGTHIPVYYADHDPGRSEVVLTRPEVDDVGEPYQDEENMAAVLVRKDPNTGHVLLDGVVADLAVRPVPQAVVSRLKQASKSSENLQRNLRARLDTATPVNSTSQLNDHVLLEDHVKNPTFDLLLDDSLPSMAKDDANSDWDQETTQQYLFRTIPESENRRQDIQSLRSEETDGGAVHVVFKINLYRSNEEDRKESNVTDEPITFTSHESSTVHRSERDTDLILYPEVLAFVDYDTFTLHRQNVTAIQKYFISFWNAVDLLFKLTRSPRFKISLAGLVIARSRDALPFINNNHGPNNTLNIYDAMRDMTSFLYHERKLGVYDMAVVITKLDMCSPGGGELCRTKSIGYAYLGAACRVLLDAKAVASLAFVEDSGDYMGVSTAAHEIGHLLGAVHDSTPAPGFLGGSGATDCPDNQFIMGTTSRVGAKDHMWSQCSLDQFRHFTEVLGRGGCLYNKPEGVDASSRAVPGTSVLTLDQQCLNEMGTFGCRLNENVCVRLYCRNKLDDGCTSTRGAAEGSTCGKNKICLGSQCVHTL